jgi:serine/threonine-protein kinase
MSPERRKLVDAVVHEALARGQYEREAFLGERCGDDADLRSSVIAALEAHEAARDFLEPPVKAAALGLLSEFGDFAVIGSDVGPYRLTELVASGGMGTVYKAVRGQEDPGPAVAVKLIRPGLISPESLRRFKQERSALARLHHPNISALLDGGVSELGLPFLVMEYVAGEPIDRYCDRMRLSVGDRLRLMRTVCGAVEFAHRNLVVHRDLKPGNILVTDDGFPKLLDFGISKLLDPEGIGPTTAVTGTGLHLATPQYASPEAIRGEPASTAMDVYSLGLILYELLTGHRAYDLRNKLPFEIQRIICDTDPVVPSAMVTQPIVTTLAECTTGTLTPEALSRFRASTPDELGRSLRGDLDTVLLTALHKDLRRRYSSVERFAEDLDRHLSGFPIRAQKDTLRYRTQKFLHRHRRGVAVAFVLLLMLVGGIAGTTHGLFQARREASRSRLEAAKAEQITGFLRHMLATADPEVGRPDMTVKQVLETAAARVETELSDQPLVRAAIHQTIGDTYFGLGLHGDAADHLRASLTLRRQAYGGSHALVAEALASLGAVLRETGVYDEAENLLQEAIAIARTPGSGAQRLLGSALTSLAGVQIDRGDFAAAEATLRAAMGAAQRLFGPDDPRTAEPMERMAILVAMRQQYDEAESLGRRALDIYRTHFGDDDPRVANSTRRVAEVLHLRGEYAEAEEHYRAALALARRRLGPDHRSVARILNNFGVMLNTIGRQPEAVPMLQEAIAIRRRAFGSEHLVVAGSLNNLATMLDAQGAEPLLRESLAITSKLFGREHPEAGLAMQNLAASLKQQGHLDDAEPLYRNALTVFEKVHGRQHPRASFPLIGLGEIALARGDAEEARALCAEALTIRRRGLPGNDAEVARAEDALGAALMALGKLDEAEPLLLHSYELLGRTFGASDEDALTAASRLIDLYEAMGDSGKAEEYRRAVSAATAPRPGPRPAESADNAS